MQKSTLCPSARENSPDSVIFGIAAGTVEEPRVAYLPEIQPVTAEILALAQPVTPTEVFRFAASCAEKECVHFDGKDCRLARRVAQGLAEVTDILPPVESGKTVAGGYRKEKPLVCAVRRLSLTTIILPKLS